MSKKNKKKKQDKRAKKNNRYAVHEAGREERIKKRLEKAARAEVTQEQRGFII